MSKVEDERKKREISENEPILGHCLVPPPHTPSKSRPTKSPTRVSPSLDSSCRHHLDLRTVTSQAFTIASSPTCRRRPGNRALRTVTSISLRSIPLTLPCALSPTCKFCFFESPTATPQEHLLTPLSDLDAFYVRVFHPL
jgi:hypothetical protein